MNTCAQCRFWKQWGPDWGQCELSSDKEIEGVLPESRKFRVNSDLDHGILTTRGDFGCVQFEAIALDVSLRGSDA